ncbi:MAG: hypothetical protein F6J90_24705 [Moorea sp. SIOASIH]|uniref:hypothetical protein n=1 Tax=Moorena sp. SIOASIH TaxID=2607817 RepID=UPI0013B9C6EA|nr:hypothetical protein [Moorena sp. SIOASIH]NEO39359.1 hypothetical protein [Moorena sp. SIOASIH]
MGRWGDGEIFIKGNYPQMRSDSLLPWFPKGFQGAPPSHGTQLSYPYSLLPTPYSLLPTPENPKGVSPSPN